MRVSAVLIAALCGLSAVSAGESDPRHDFEMQVRPLLAKNCFACHTHSAMGGLRLDNRDSLLKGGKSGPAVVPGNSSGSLLIQAVTHKHDRLKMPPSGKLADQDVQ